MYQNHFDFVGCKEAARTRIFTVSEVQIVFVRCGKLMVATLARLEAFFVVPETIIFDRIIKMICIVRDAVGGHTQMGAYRELNTVRESDRFANNPAKTHCIFGLALVG